MTDAFETIDLIVHMPEPHDCAWWAEAPDLEGFTASADDLQSLLSYSKLALAELFGGNLKVVPRLAEPLGSAGDGVETEVTGQDLEELVA